MDAAEDVDQSMTLWKERRKQRKIQLPGGTRRGEALLNKRLLERVFVGGGKKEEKEKVTKRNR